MIKEEKVVLGILQNISKNINSKKWNCLANGCTETAINSHLLQVNGVLHHLVEEGHLIQIKPNDFFDIEKKGFLSFKSVGVKQAISDFLFCNKHDTQIFKDIEEEDTDFNDYRNQLLFSYRALCCELRKKMKNTEMFTRIKKANSLTINGKEFIAAEYLDLEIKGHHLGIKDMTWFKEQMESELADDGEKNFVFRTFRCPLIAICVSAVFSPIHPGSASVQKAIRQEKPLNTIFINVIPQEHYLYVIVGYHMDYTDKWITDYVDSWDVKEVVDIQTRLTDLVATKVETWSLSPFLFRRISAESKKRFKDYWDSNTHNLLSNQKVNFNFFDAEKN